MSDNMTPQDALNAPQPLQVIDGGQGDEKQIPPMPTIPDSLPEDCPVVPLGQDPSGGAFYYKTGSNLVMRLKIGDHGLLNLVGLFAPHSQWLFDNYPVWTKDKKGDWTKKPNTFKRELIAPILMDTAAQAGVWDADEKVRGAGCWVDIDGGLVVNRGTDITVYPLTGVPQKHKPGMIGKHFYAAYTNLGAVSNKNCAAAGGELLQILEKWSWTYPDIDARLLLGWIGGAMIGGALPWRPMMWITGSSGSGKSTLQGAIKKIFGGSIHSLTDATAAGIRQQLGNTTLPIALDEQENKGDNRKANAIVEQMRLASSGGTMSRGGQDHKAHTFTARSSYLASSIRKPPLQQQDNNRITALSLKPVKHAGEIDLPSERELHDLGLRLLGRMVEVWPKFERIRKGWWDLIRDQNAENRISDQLGTLLALSDALLKSDEALAYPPHSDELPEELMSMIEEEKSHAVPDWEGWLQFLLSSRIQPSGASMATPTIGEMLADVLEGKDDENNGGYGNDGGGTNARKRNLARAGMKITKNRDIGSQYLVVANVNPALLAIHADTHWCGEVGGVTAGWVQAARTAPDHVVLQLERFLGVRSRATGIPLQLVRDVMGLGEEE